MAELPLNKTSTEQDPNKTAAFDDGQTGAASHSATSHSATSDSKSDVTTDFNQADSDPSSMSARGRTGTKQPPLTTIASYRLETLLGEGGMGRVYKALDGQGRAVAIKLLSSRWTCSDDALQRFKQEGYIASQINHPHCVFVHRVDEDRGMPFIAMELMSGRTLKDLVVERGALPFREAVQLILQCIEGLIEAHRQGMIHRDIKPANCYLDEHGSVKIGDFGLARSLVDDSELTRTGAFLGTPLFASPEQLLGQALDERSDIYSLSATLYYLLAGRAPFESPNSAQVIAKIASSDPPGFAEVGVRVPQVLEGIVMRGLARDRNKRFESFQQLRAALLPIVLPDHDIAALPRRILAGFIDSILVVMLMGLLSMLLLRLTPAESNTSQAWLGVWASLGGSLLLLFYYWTSEWLFGCSPGKRLMRLCVVDAETNGRTTVRQSGLRSALFVANNNGLELLGHLVFQGRILSLPLLAWVSELLGWSLMLISWKLTGRRQFGHEWLSGTVTRFAMPQRVSANVELTLPQWSAPAMPVSAPTTIGRFKLETQLKTTDSSEWFVAYDGGLDRQVWINVLPSGSPPLSEQRKKCTRRARMRVIESGALGTKSWDAYLAPEGVPLSAYTQGGGVFPWPLARQLFHQLIDEHSSADSQAIREQDWNSRRVWVDGAGRATFCEPELDHAAASGPQGLRSLLVDVAWATLPIRHPLRRKHFRAEAARETRSQPRKLLAISDLPPYRGLLFLESLVRGRFQLAQIKQELNRIDQTAEQVTPALRMAHALTIGIAMFPLFLVAWFSMSLNVMMYTDQLREETQQLYTLAKVIESADQYPELWSAVTPQVRTELQQPGAAQEIRSIAESVWDERSAILDHANALEQRMLVEAYSPTPIDQKPSALPIRSGPSAQGAQTAGLNRGETAEAAAVLRDYYPLYVSWQNGAPPDNRNAPWLAGIIGWTIGAYWAWAVLTCGGLLPIFTGVISARRDGCRMGRWRCAWRSFLLFAPLAVVGLLGLYLECLGWWGWGAQLKLLFVALPILYVAAAFVWPQVGPHDRLSYCAAVPR